MKKLIKKIILFISRCLALISGLPLNSKNYRAAFYSLFDNYLFNLNKYSNKLATFHLRPKYENQIFSDNIFMQNKTYEDTAIVIQGPLVTQDNFTLETVKLYIRLFPKAKIIVSTWCNSDKSTLEGIEISGAAVIENKRPTCSGSHNVNYQIVSTIAGINYAKSKNAKYVLKTRCDQRFYAENTLIILKKYLQIYKPDDGINAMGRIIEPGITVCKYRPWSMCDMFQFGFAEDMQKMWSVELDERSQTQEEFASKKYRVIDIVKENVSEIYIHRKYASAIGLSSDISSASYYDFIRKATVIFNKEEVDLMWYKYSASEYGWAGNPLYDKTRTLSRLSHIEWQRVHDGEFINFEKINSYLNTYEN